MEITLTLTELIVLLLIDNIVFYILARKYIVSQVKRRKSVNHRETDTSKLVQLTDRGTETTDLNNNLNETQHEVEEDNEHTEGDQHYWLDKIAKIIQTNHCISNYEIKLYFAIICANRFHYVLTSTKLIYRCLDLENPCKDSIPSFSGTKLFVKRSKSTFTEHIRKALKGIAENQPMHDFIKMSENDREVFKRHQNGQSPEMGERCILDAAGTDKIELDFLDKNKNLFEYLL